MRSFRALLAFAAVVIILNAFLAVEVAAAVAAAVPLPVRDGLVALYRMQEAAGRPRTAEDGGGRAHRYALYEAQFESGAASKGERPRINATTVARTEGGIFGPYAARFNGSGQMLLAPRAESPALSAAIAGPHATLSLFVWAKKRGGGGRRAASMEFVAGVWSETLAKRQYAMFLDLDKGALSQLIDDEVSAVGGPTPGHRWCVTRAIGTRPVAAEVWNCLALTYDGAQIRAYNNGTLERRGNGTGGDDFYSNPFNYTKGVFRVPPGEEGMPFTVGGKISDEDAFFEGDIGGVALYNRALGDDEVRAVCHATLPPEA